jgi:hypothetical protein
MDDPKRRGRSSTYSPPVIGEACPAIGIANCLSETHRQETAAGLGLPPPGSMVKRFFAEVTE